jgi:hypothetical protein
LLSGDMVELSVGEIFVGRISAIHQRKSGLPDLRSIILQVGLA